jgi:hypothetical protein
MPTDTLQADPELQRENGPEATPETPHQHPHDDRNIDGAVGDGDGIALLAYRYWQERGCPDGCPEHDWFRAERELTESRVKA